MGEAKFSRFAKGWSSIPTGLATPEVRSQWLNHEASRSGVMPRQMRHEPSLQLATIRLPSPVK